MANDNAENANDSVTADVSAEVKKMEENRLAAEEAERAQRELKMKVEQERNTGNLAAQMLPRLADMGSDPGVLVDRAWRIADAMVAHGKRRMEKLINQ